MHRCIRLILLLLCVSILDAYKYFQDKIPNGDHIPHPCKPNFLWRGVGHENVDGGGDRNPFGIDFKANNFKWNKCLCERDSDGDGKTNGEELGDPNCSWTEGSIPERTNGLSHPGVCEPLDSAECIGRNNWEFCDYEEFTCDAINEPDVIQIPLTFPKTTVPDRETTYWCMTFDLDDLDPDTDYHVIANEPKIDNANVMHHAVIYGCNPTEEQLVDDSWKITSPTECGMALQVCQNILSVWTLGLNGECLPNEYGYRVGKTGAKTVLMQFHWNNPERRSDYEDASGMVMHVTPHLRANDAATLNVGSLTLTLPPGQQSLSQESFCHSRCSERFNQSLYFSNVMFHMHYLGTSAALEHNRGSDIVGIVSEPDYSYDNPKNIRFEEPVEFLPGDELKLTCNFKSTSRSTMTYFGDATSDEMCFAFITYYPARKDFNGCMTYNSLDVCETGPGGTFETYPLGECSFTTFFNQSNLSPIIQAVVSACTSATEKCPEGCKPVIDNLRQNNPCLKPGDVSSYMLIEIMGRYFGDYVKNWVDLFYSCDDDWDRSILFPEDRVVNIVTNGGPSDGEVPDNDGECVFDLDDNDNTNGAVPVTAGTQSVALFCILTAALLRGI